ncbi:MAG: NAD(P)/FAD-dependent oxidoreductase [Acidobacteriota bacterium]
MKTNILIVGAGFAGAATAYHLSRLTDQSITILEQEEIPGFHASGRNASLLMQSAENRDIRRLIVASRSAYATIENLTLSSAGSLLLGTSQALEAIREPGIIPSEFCEPDQVRKAIPLLHGHVFEKALFTPSDAVMDIGALLQHYLTGAQQRGVKLFLKHRVEQLQFDGQFRVRAANQDITADYLINAAGAWAGPVASMAGAASVPLTPLKRHLFVLGDIPDVRSDWPFVWDFSRNFYFRPESGQLLFSICDEQLCKSLEPTVDPDVIEDLAELIWRELPSLQDAVQKRAWSCFRTKTPDGRFVIGWDPIRSNLLWVAGLGGHGMGASWEVGRLAAEIFCGRSQAPNPFDPARFAAAQPAAIQKSALES